MTPPRPIRVLVAKVGLDGHDVGAKLLCRAFVEAGFEAIYTGLRRTPEDVARTATDEDVDVVALSLLSGAHVALTKRVSEALRAAGREDILLLVGGLIPERDRPALASLGAAGVFPVGCPFAEVIGFVRERAGRSHAA